MKAVTLALLSLLTANLSAEWPVVKPTDFEPLVSLPWEQRDATMETVLPAIFREPNQEIRYRVLGEYLRQVGREKISKAFDMCVPLEGTQNPDDLVALFIPIWVEHDPQGCWAWVKKLFRVTGIENGVLGYDSWNHAKITVRDLKAIRASPFWIESKALSGFPQAIDRAKLPKNERVRIMKEFSEMWFSAFFSWPDYRPGAYAELGFLRDPGAQRALIEIFRGPVTPDKISIVFSWFDKSSGVTELIHEVAFRRMLKADPKSASEVVRKARERIPTDAEGRPKNWIKRPSNELLLVWAMSDLPGMIRWVDSLGEDDGELADRSKGLLMALCDDATRKRWLAEAKANAEEEREASLFESWAEWDLEGALEAAINAENPESTASMANSAVYGPWHQPWNQSRYAFQVLSRFDYSKLPPKIHSEVLAECYSLMEQWDSMDVASAAQFGYAYLLRTNYAPREGLIEFFSGKDIYGGEDGMIDRTFCALRVWAVVRPDEMRKWIATIKDAEMRKALTWLLENPWGTGKDE